MPMLKLTLLIAALALSACSTSFRVSTDYDDQFSFNNKTSYALITPEAIQTTRNDLLKGRIENALQKQLALKGFTQVDKASADIWISYFATTEKQQDIRTYQRYNSFYGYARCYRCYYPAPVASTEVQVVDYTEASLIIDFIDPASNTLKWRGSTSSKVTTASADSMTVAERTEKIDRAVSAILQQYPPANPSP